MQKCKQTEDREISWDRALMSEFPILYQQHDKSMRETCMCWGLECDQGWTEPIRRMSAKLETLNLLFYPKYRIRIQMDQLKEKYGTLRAYTSVVHDPGLIKIFLNNVFTRALNWIDKNVDFKMTEIEDHPAYDKVEIVELKDKAEFVKEQYACRSISNVKVEEKDGKYFKTTTLTYFRRSHMEPTKHLFVRKIMTMIRNVTYRLTEIPMRNWKQEVIYDYMSDKANEIVRDAEKECYDVCEKCGHQIGTDWSPRCETRGWITYICDKCAKDSKRQYFMNGALYERDKLLKTKAEIDAEREEIERKHAKNYAKYKHEREEFEKELEKAKHEENEAQS